MKISTFTLGVLCCGLIISCQHPVKQTNKEFSTDFRSDECTFSTSGKNPYYILEPGYQLVLEGKQGNETFGLVTTVRDETKTIGGIETRVVEENESINGDTVEVSRNYLAYCEQTSSIFYFGEEVNMYREGKVVGHEGSWLAEGKNKPGILIPGTVLLGSRYYEEIAPGIAMDRAEIISTAETLKTQAGMFTGCLKVKEGNAMNPMEKEYKLYAPGVGLIQDENLQLVKYGFIQANEQEND